MILSIEHQKQFEAHRRTIDKLIAMIANNPKEINDEVIENPASIRVWEPGSFNMNDVRAHEGTPQKCVQAHDSSENEDWTPADYPALWMQYHGTTFETARPWISPTGAHDMYKIGEYMIYTDGLIYQCITDTTYDPMAYPTAWEVVK